MTLSFFPAQTKISMRWDLSFTGIVALKWARIGGPTMASFQFILRANSGKRTRTIFHERELARHNAWLGTLLFRLLFNGLQCRLRAKPRILAIQNTHWAVHPYKQTGIRPTSVTWKGKWTREMSSFSWQLIKNVSRAAINPQISDRRRGENVTLFNQDAPSGCNWAPNPIYLSLFVVVRKRRYHGEAQSSGN